MNFKTVIVALGALFLNTSPAEAGPVTFGACGTVCYIKCGAVGVLTGPIGLSICMTSCLAACAPVVVAPTP